METHGTNGDACQCVERPRPKLAPLTTRTVSWSENTNDDIEIPGTPKTPRTSTTPGNNVHSIFIIQDF